MTRNAAPLTKAILAIASISVSAREASDDVMKSIIVLEV